MNIVLSAKAVEKHGKEYISLWYNGKNVIITAPINPYFYSKEKLNINCFKITEVEGIALSDFQKRRFFKFEFKTRQNLVDARNEMQDIGKKCFETNIPFILRCRLDCKDIYQKCPHINDLKLMFIDIEQFCPKGKMFPSYDDRMLSISFATNDRVVKTIYLKKDTVSDKMLLEKFIEFFRKEQPDVLVGYNIKGYDLPVIFNRCHKNRIDTKLFSRNEEKPYVGGKEDVYIPGCIVFDILDSTSGDQSLTGNVINKTLKETSNWFGYIEKKKPLNPKKLYEYDIKELIEYNKSDIERLFVLFDVYWNNIVYTATDLGLPLDYVAGDFSITDLALIVVGDEYKRLGIIADGTNEDRYPQIFKREKSKFEANYQGALIFLYKSGLFKPVYKADFSSMYPSIMSTFNFSPDVMTLLYFEPFGKFSVTEEEYWYIYSIPDDILRKNIVIQVLKKQGFMSSVVGRFLKERKEFKKLAKETGENKYKSMSDVAKVKSNGVYGISGSPTHAFGFLPIAAATTGVGRESIQLLIDILNELYPKSVIECDTDGAYFTTTNFNKEEVLKLFEQRLKEKFKKDLKLSIDFDEYDSGYFYLAKNYTLKRGNKIIYHGVALKASGKDLLCKSLIKEMAEAKHAIQPTDEIVRRYQKLDFTLEYFAMNVKLGMPLNQYKNPHSTLVSRLAIEARDTLDILATVGQQYYYIKTVGGYKLYELSKLSEIDRQYYLEEIQGIVDIFQEKRVIQTIDKWY